MKIGRLVYGKRLSGMSKSIVTNFGDNIQTLALDRIIQKHFSDKDIVDMNIYELPTYDGEEVLLPLCCYLFTCDEGYFLPASDKIIPLFLSVSFQVAPYSKKSISYLKKHSPIGCRDINTFLMMKKLKIDAYLSGCVTLTLERRKENISISNGGKVFLVDAPKEIKGFIPEKFKNSLEKIKQIVDFKDDIEGSAENTDKAAKALYERYENEAALVITSKLHCVQPCLAMGIPVIVARNSPSCRFELVEKLSHVYLPSEFKNINWNPPIKEFEDLKKNISSVMESRILRKKPNNFEIKWLNNYWKECKHDDVASTERFIVNCIKKSGYKKWALWGVTGYIAKFFYEIIKKECPKMELVYLIDQLKVCNAYGLVSKKAEQIDSFEGIFVMVSTSSGSEFAKKFLSQKGLELKKDYLTIDTII